VKITASRSRGIVFDGKNTGFTAQRNVVRNCVITNVQGDGIELLGATNNLIEGCTIINAGGHGIQLAKASPTTQQPNKKSTDNTIRNNTIDNSGQDGINLTGGDRNRIEGNRVTNSAESSTSRDGIRFDTADGVSCNDNIVQGNTATDNQAAKTQRFGLAITSALCNRTVVGVQSLAGNKVGPIFDQGTGTLIAGGPPSAPGAFTFTPVADAYVDQAIPTMNYGASTVLRTDASPVVRTYLRFQVANVTGTVRSVKLRIYATSASATGFEVRRVTDNSWGETTISFSNAPAVGTVARPSTSFAAGGYVEVDVTALVAGNGTHSFAINGLSSTATAYASRETATKPQLVFNAG
jgi:parallel beta-helix repeat protein